jgi:hypothetical protein
MKIGILYIAIGDYVMFWDKFYSSAEKYFLPNEEKHYYVFTDAKNINYEKSSNVHRLYQKDLGWPGNTLFRYHIFAKHIYAYRDMDYLFFFNANLEFKEFVSRDILSEDKLIVVQHFGYRLLSPQEFPYDRNPESHAYIPFDRGKDYVCGGFNGGKTDVYISMILELQKAIEDDYVQGIVAKWHDESHINKYILSHPYIMLHPGYVHPQGWYRLPYPCIVLLRDKVIYGGRIFLSKKGCSWKEICKYYLRYLYNMLRKH